MLRPDVIVAEIPARARHDAILRRFLISSPDLRALLLATLPVSAIAAFLLIAPMQLYSREMTWDFLFNLDGAWRIRNGQVPHVDFHTELGTLPFALTALAFHLVGTNVMAFLVGECLLATIVLVLSVAAVTERAPLVPAAIFTILCTLITLMPSSYGDTGGAFSFAMAYNRFGWSISAILFVLLFVEPVRPQWSPLKDCLVGLVALLLLYYVKITYFAVGIAALLFALVGPGCVRANRARWLAVLAVTGLCAVAPSNFDYLRDMMDQVLAGSARTNIVESVARFVTNPAEYAVALAGCLLLTAASSRGQVQGQAVAGAWFVTVAGFLLLSQNEQNQGIPIYAVVGLLLYRAARDLMSIWMDDAGVGRRLGVARP